MLLFIYPIVILSGSSGNADFRGFLIQGRTMATNTAVGTFVDNGGDQRTACTNNVCVQVT